MKKPPSLFQIIFSALFVVFAIGGMIVVSTYRGGSKANVPMITIWGDLSENQIRPVVDRLNNAFSDEFKIQYFFKSTSIFERNLLEALAEDRGPDLIVLHDDTILKYTSKLYPISFDLVTKRNFKDSFVEGAEIFFINNSIVALPFQIDPIVMYWNRGLFSDAGISNPPQYWDELFFIAQKLSKKVDSINLERSGVALGGIDNINHAKSILSAMVIQTGNPIVEKKQSGGVDLFNSTLNISVGDNTVASVLDFYTTFAKPEKLAYSWNEGMDNSIDEFSFGNTALYFGLASDYEKISAKNPNLNFDVSILPQLRGSSGKSTYGKISGLSVLKSSRNINTAIKVAIEFSGKNSLSLLTENLPSVRRDLYVNESDPYRSVFNQSALISKAWYDPDSVETEKIFKSLVSAGLSKTSNISIGLRNAQDNLNNLLNKK